MPLGEEPPVFLMCSFPSGSSKICVRVQTGFVMRCCWFEAAVGWVYCVPTECERQIELGQATIKTYCHQKCVAEGPRFVAEAEVYVLRLLTVPLIEVPCR